MSKAVADYMLARRSEIFHISADKLQGRSYIAQRLANSRECEWFVRLCMKAREIACARGPKGYWAFSLELFILRENGTAQWIIDEMMEAKKSGLSTSKSDVYKRWAESVGCRWGINPNSFNYNKEETAGRKQDSEVQNALETLVKGTDLATYIASPKEKAHGEVEQRLKAIAVGAISVRNARKDPRNHCH